MKHRKWLFVASLWLNVILLVALAGGYVYLRLQSRFWEWGATSWASYAGALQCMADHEQGRNRYYRLVASPATPGHYENHFTGEYKNGVEIWSWPWYPGDGFLDLTLVSRAANQAFIKAYNGRMDTFVKEAATRPADPPQAATQSLP